jgi:hypothetical protein
MIRELKFFRGGAQFWTNDFFFGFFLLKRTIYCLLSVVFCKLLMQGVDIWWSFASNISSVRFAFFVSLLSFFLRMVESTYF